MSVTPGWSTQNLDLPSDVIARFCRKWKITKLEVFGSALREDFGPVSDVDFMVTFDEQARWSLFDLVDAEQDMRAIVARPVDLVERIPIEKSSNWIRRKAIFDSAHTIYVA